MSRVREETTAASAARLHHVVMPGEGPASTSALIAARKYVDAGPSPGKTTWYRRRALACIGVLLLLAGCDATDPYKREGVWRPSDSNDANLRAMVMSPSDLVRGVESPGDGQQAAAALDRLRQDKMRVLPESSIAKVVPVSGGSGDVQGSH